MLYLGSSTTSTEYMVGKFGKSKECNILLEVEVNYSKLFMACHGATIGHHSTRGTSKQHQVTTNRYYHHQQHAPHQAFIKLGFPNLEAFLGPHLPHSIPEALMYLRTSGGGQKT
jgi:hypothetical protein